MRYSIVEGPFTDYDKTKRLVDYINNAIKGGWLPIGGISVVTRGDGELWAAQSMINYDKES